MKKLLRNSKRVSEFRDIYEDLLGDDMNCSEIAKELLEASVEAGNDEINALDTELDQDGSDYEYFEVPLA